MRYKVFVILCTSILFACKPKATEIKNDSEKIEVIEHDSITDTLSEEIGSKRTIKQRKKKTKDTTVYFQTIERIFEDEFNLIFANDSNDIVKFFFVPGLNQDNNYSFISESEGDFVSNLQLEGKKFKITYSIEKYLTFDGESKDYKIIESILLLDTLKNETADQLYLRMERELTQLQSYIANINWEEAVRIDTANILYEEDFRYQHINQIHKTFIEINDCAKDSFFVEYYSDRTIKIEGTDPIIMWTLDFSVPTLNIKHGEPKNSIIEKLGIPSYDFDSILVYPKYIPDVIVENEGGGTNFDDTVFLIFKNDRLIGIIASFYYLC